MTTTGSAPTGQDRWLAGKTAQLVGLFAAVVLVTTTGCGPTGNGPSRHVHVDRNGDGYCDDDGERVSQGQGGGYYHSGGYYVPTPDRPVSSPPAGNASISSGAAPKGGIGGSIRGGGG